MTSLVESVSGGSGEALSLMGDDRGSGKALLLLLMGDDGGVGLTISKEGMNLVWSWKEWCSAPGDDLNGSGGKTSPTSGNSGACAWWRGDRTLTSVVGVDSGIAKRCWLNEDDLRVRAQ